MGAVAVCWYHPNPMKGIIASAFTTPGITFLPLALGLLLLLLPLRGE